MAHESGGAERGAPPDITGPLLLWLLLQTGALSLSAGRIPLAADYARPAEMLAAHVMLVTQVTAASLLFPYLMRTAQSAAAVCATSIPFVVMAGNLSAAPADRIAAAAMFLTLWLAALAAWRFALRDRAWRQVGAAVAALIGVGTLVVFYLQLEFGATAGGAYDPASLADSWSVVSPPLAALRQLSHPLDVRQWSLPAAALAGGVVAHFLLRRRGQVIHNF